MIPELIKWIILFGFWNMEVMVVGSQNLALYKPARQINVFYERWPSMAVDGNVNNVYEYCAHTHNASTSVPNWWMVDLGANYEITNVNILNRADCCAERLSNFTVSVWQYDPGPHIKHNMVESEFCVCVTHPTMVPQNQWANLTCTQICLGRFVLVVSNPNDYFVMCEVEVFGNPYNGCSAQDKYLKKIEGRRSSPPNCPLSSSQVSHEYECSHRCLQMQNCVSFNYSPQLVNGSNCQLVFCFSHPEQDMIADSNWHWRYISL